MGSLAQKTKKLQANELKSLFAHIPFQKVRTQIDVFLGHNDSVERGPTVRANRL